MEFLAERERNWGALATTASAAAGIIGMLGGYSASSGQGNDRRSFSWWQKVMLSEPSAGLGALAHATFNVVRPEVLPPKASGQAYTTINGTMVYLGVYGSEESKQKYRLLAAEFLGGDAAAAACRPRVAVSLCPC